MKKTLSFLFLTIIPLWLNAQCDDCYSEKPEIAVGVTLLSNMKFTPQRQSNQPLELNLRYKLSEISTLRLGTPIVWKQNIPEEPFSYYHTPTLEEYVENMHDEDIAGYYNSFYRVLDFYYSLYGFSLGYDYNFTLKNNFSVFIGCDLGYYHQKVTSNFYRLNNSILNEDQTFKYPYFLQKSERIYRHNVFSAKPLLGLRFTIQKLSLEAEISYPFAYDYLDLKGINRFWYSEINLFEEYDIDYSSQNFFTNTSDSERMVYSLRLFYNF